MDSRKSVKKCAENSSNWIVISWGDNTFLADCWRQFPWVVTSDERSHAKTIKTQLIFESYLYKLCGYFSVGWTASHWIISTKLIFPSVVVKTSLVTAFSLLIFQFPSRKASTLVTSFFISLLRFSAFVFHTNRPVFFPRTEAYAAARQ